MKILIATPIFHPENHRITNFVSSFYDFAKKDNSVHVVAFGKAHTSSDSNINIINKRENMIVRNLKFIFSIIKNRDVDFIFCQNAITAAIPSLIVAKIFKIKLVVNFSNDEIYERFLFLHKNNISLEDFYKKQPTLNIGFYLRFLTSIQKNILKFADVVVVPNDYFKRIFCEKYQLKLSNFVTIYPFISDKNESPFETTKDLFSLMTSVALQSNAESEVKNLILAIKKLHKVYPNLKLNIFGDGSSKEFLINFSIKNQTNTFIYFHGKVSNTELTHYKKMSSTFILLFPSVRNFFNLFENFEYRTISLFSSNRIAQEHIMNLKNGLMFDPENPNDLEEKISQILVDKKLRDAVLENSARELERTYNLNKYLSCLLNIVKKQI